MRLVLLDAAGGGGRPGHGEELDVRRGAHHEAGHAQLLCERRGEAGAVRLVRVRVRVKVRARLRLRVRLRLRIPVRVRVRVRVRRRVRVRLRLT